MRVIAIGDVCGPVGCNAALKYIPRLKYDYKPDMIIVNGENSAIGNGITPHSADLLFSAGADVITGGNHSLRREEIYEYLENNPFIIRPDNIKSDWGSGYCLVDKGRFSAAIINLSGQIYLDRLSASNPFTAADNLIEKADNDGADFIIVDFHAEATSEKRALGLYLDGRVSAVFGTHTHIQTADAQILPHGTGYITDIGMTGPIHSVLGVKSEIIINRLKNGDLSKFEFADGKALINGCIFDIDNKTKSATFVNNICIREE